MNDGAHKYKERQRSKQNVTLPPSNKNSFKKALPNLWAEARLLQGKRETLPEALEEKLQCSLTNK